MNRLRTHRILFAAILMALTTASIHAAANRPNIIVLFVDDLGWKDLGCYGGPVETPNLDRMAAKGIRFTDFHSASGVCSPSRASLLTGRHHMRTGVYSVIRHWHKMRFMEREVTVAEMLKEHGYATAHIGKWHIGALTGENKTTPDRHGFDYWFATTSGSSPSHKDPRNFIRNGKWVGQMKGYSCQLLVDEAISWMKDKKDKPFFINMWFHEPHAPIAAPDKIVSKYGGLKDRAAIYSGTIDNTDDAIGRLVAELKKQDKLKNTLIVYASDNGSYRQDRCGKLRGKKGSMFEGGHRVPGIFYWPGTISPKQVEDEPAGMIDLLPTIAGILDIAPPKGVDLDGADISPLLMGKPKKFKREQMMFWCSAGWPTAVVRHGKFFLAAYARAEIPRDKEKLATLFKQIEKIMIETNDPLLTNGRIQTINFSGQPQDKQARKLLMEYHKSSRFLETWIPAIKNAKIFRYELFDLEKDISQTKDVSKQHPEVFEKMKKELLRIRTSVMAESPDWK